MAIAYAWAMIELTRHKHKQVPWFMLLVHVMVSPMSRVLINNKN